MTATAVRDNIYLIDVVLRADEESRTSIENLKALDLPLPGGKSVALAAVANIDFVQDYPLVWRRDRLPTLTVQADVRFRKHTTSVPDGRHWQSPTCSTA